MRRFCQYLSTVLINSYFKLIFTSGLIYAGNLKYFCVPALNCYSCPLAVFSCPIGAIQFLASGMKHQVSLYVFGLLSSVGAVVGRMACGWICPFGLFQDLMFKIPSPKMHIPRILDYCKYAVLAVLVLSLPALLVDEFGLGDVYFCKWVCPAGTLEAGIPLIFMSDSLRGQIGTLFTVKVSILAAFLVWMVFAKRPFCRTSCPLGAIYSVFNRVSLFIMDVNDERCVECDTCHKTCPMSLKVYKATNNKDCIRCLQCRDYCPQGAVTFRPRTKETGESMGEVAQSEG